MCRCRESIAVYAGKAIVSLTMYLRKEKPPVRMHKRISSAVERSSRSRLQHAQPALTPAFAVDRRRGFACFALISGAACSATCFEP